MALYAHYRLPVYASLGLLLWPSGGLWDYASAFPTGEERRQDPWAPPGYWYAEQWGTVPTPSPAPPMPPRTLPHPGGRWHLSVLSGNSFCQFRVGASWQAHVSTRDRRPRCCSPFGPRGPGQASLPSRWLPQSGSRVPVLLVRSCLLSSQASVSPHREPVTPVLPPACCFCEGRLS